MKPQDNAYVHNDGIEYCLKPNYMQLIIAQNQPVHQLVELDSILQVKYSAPKGIWLYSYIRQCCSDTRVQATA